MASVLSKGRWNVVIRIVLAVVSGYILSNLVSIALALFSPQVLAEAVLTFTLLSFLIYALIIIWVFADPSLKRIVYCQLGGGCLLALVVVLNTGMMA